MDKIWYENPSKSEVIGPCGGDEKTALFGMGHLSVYLVLWL